MGLILARIGSGLLQAMLIVFAARKHVQLPVRDSFSAFFRPLIGALAMYQLLVSWGHWVSQPVLNLFFCVVVGSIFYSVWLFLSWWFVGSPEGLESTTIGFLKSKVGKR